MKTLWYVFSVVFIITCFMVGSVGADPPWVSNTWYVNGNTGDDSNGGTNAGGDAWKTFAHALVVIGDDSHARIIWAGRGNKDISDTPTAEQARQYISIMEDRGSQTFKQEVVAGHGLLPTDTVDTTAVGGVGLSQQWVWETFTNRNGLQERLINIIETVVPEDYDPVP